MVDALSALQFEFNIPDTYLESFCYLHACYRHAVFSPELGGYVIAVVRRRIPTRLLVHWPKKINKTWTVVVK